MTQNQKAMAGIRLAQYLKPKCARRAKLRPGYLEAAKVRHHSAHLRRLAAREEAQRQEQARQEAAAKKLAQETAAREAELWQRPRRTRIGTTTWTLFANVMAAAGRGG